MEYFPIPHPSNPLLTLRGNIYPINDLPVVEPDNRHKRLAIALVLVRERTSTRTTP
jgi:hypothetical protein